MPDCIIVLTLLCMQTGLQVCTKPHTCTAGELDAGQQNIDVV
jgi:hypothetical protein